MLSVDDVQELPRLKGIEEVAFLTLILLDFMFQVFLHRVPRHVHINGGAEDVDSAEAAPVDVKNHVLKKDCLTTSTSG